MTFGSLFSGVGGFDLGLERAGMTCKWQVEIDDFARTILRKHWPDIPKWSDVRTVGREHLERVDLIAGGFPCQDLSFAGNGAGLEGERSGLWREFIRIIRELRPRLVLVENVPALRSRGLGTVLGDLAASGFDADWDCIPAAALGAPHRRDRIFIVGTRRVRSAAELEQCECCDERWCRECGNHFFECGHFGPSSWWDALANPDDSRREGRGVELRVFGGDASEWLARARSRAIAGGWGIEPDVGRVAHGIPERVDRLRGLGNAVVPAVAEFLGRRVLEVYR